MFKNKGSINTWCSTIYPDNEPFKNDVQSPIIIDCETESETASDNTPPRQPLALKCPNAPQKRIRTSLFQCKPFGPSVSTQTDVSLGQAKTRGISLSLFSIDYACKHCKIFYLDHDQEEDAWLHCRMCGRQLKRNAASNVGLYHVSPYFE